MKHNHPLFIQKETKEPATPQIEANVSAQCKRPYLELLGSEGKRERHRVRQRERQGGGTEKYISIHIDVRKEMMHSR